ncbi:hypothetical protein AC578_5680 [Pseudocercospora eumusae]|uniref:Uncharacterized protein n=1 Tax=Pseudocercospora eumusae TaxID=321146 RepID=A0A139H3B6_9PEZI|nr:hypothetical protein AC578_5680 [Pseudocercospora eumusae]
MGKAGLRSVQGVALCEQKKISSGRSGLTMLSFIIVGTAIPKETKRQMSVSRSGSVNIDNDEEEQHADESESSQSEGQETLGLNTRDILHASTSSMETASVSAIH